MGVPSAPPIELVDRLCMYPVRAGGLPGFVLLRDRVPLDMRVRSDFSGCPDGSTYFVSRPWFDEVYRPLKDVNIRIRCRKDLQST